MPSSNLKKLKQSGDSERTAELFHALFWGMESKFLVGIHAEIVETRGMGETVGVNGNSCEHPPGCLLLMST